MSKEKCIVRQIREYGQNKGEVYAFINIIERKVYVGETGNGESRELSHAKCIFGLDTTGSNKNLIDVNQENQYCLLYLYSFNSKADGEKFWIAMETIYMYLFVKHGFQLYNSNKGKDNVGKTRKFLIDNLSEEELYKKILFFLEDYTVSKELVDDRTNKEYSVSDWKGFLDAAEEVFLNDLTNIFEENIFELSNRETRIRFWEQFVKRSRNDQNYIVLDRMGSERDFFVFNKKRLESISGGYSIEDISIKDLIDNHKMDRIIYSKAGDYLGETIYEILSNKFSDLQKKYNPIEEQQAETGTCFWAIAGEQQDWLRQVLMKEGKKESVYLFLVYTGSKSLSGETAERKAAKAFSLKRKGDKKTKYPCCYVDELIGDRNNMAFLISDFYSPKEEINSEMIEESYTAIFQNTYTNVEPSHISEGDKRKTYYLGELRDVDKEQLLRQLETVNCNKNQTRMLVARLEYPYVVALHNEAE